MYFKERETAWPGRTVHILNAAGGVRGIGDGITERREKKGKGTNRWTVQGGHSETRGKSGKDQIGEVDSFSSEFECITIENLGIHYKQ